MQCPEITIYSKILTYSLAAMALITDDAKVSASRAKCSREEESHATTIRV